MIRVEEAPTLRAETPLLGALGVMQAHGVDRALVLEHGLPSVTDVGRVLSEAAAMREAGSR
jgi:hypothetical protein